MESDNKIEIDNLVIERLANADKIVVLTGAGISAESGVKTFRDPDGIWAKFNPQELASINGFMSNPDLVWQWYQERVDVVNNVHPNPGHYALAEMESMFSNFYLLTQNVDRLHHRAGSKNVFELHGNIVTNRCFECNTPYPEEIAKGVEVPRCQECNGRIRPNVVWFGELLPQDVLEEAERQAQLCDVFITIGTSGEVYPAAGLPISASRNGATTIEINPNKTSISNYHNFNIFAPSGVALPLIIEKLKEKRK